jgi:hypothetical protein
LLKKFEAHYADNKSKLFPINPVKYSGSEKRERGSNSKSGVDFYLENNLTLSVKTNKSKSYKVCPPEIGQPSPRTFDLYFSKKGWYQGPVDDYKFRKLVRDKRILSQLLLEYVKYLNECDFLLWSLYLSTEQIKSVLVSKSQLKNICFEPNLIQYSNEFTEQSSVTIKYGLEAITIGEFQIHSARTSLKFRFNFNSLLTISS